MCAIRLFATALRRYGSVAQQPNSVRGGNIACEDRGPAGVTKGVGKGVGMSQFPAVGERTIGSPGGLIRITAMPERQG